MRDQHFNFTLVERLLFFWAAAPDEELSQGDIVMKARASQRTVQNALYELQSRGILVSKRAPHSGEVGGSAVRLWFLSPEARDMLTSPLAHTWATPSSEGDLP